MRLLFVTPYRPNGAIGGREQLSALHARALRDILESSFHEYPLHQGQVSVWKRLTGQIDGVSDVSARDILKTVDALAIDTLWLDGTNLGLLARRLRTGRPSLRVISFAHNVEADFFADALRRSRTLHALGVMVANRVAEQWSLRHSSDIIALNDRDSVRFSELYGRGADGILPMALMEPNPRIAPTEIRDQAYVLFVGGGFFANRQGIEWFAANVSPHLSVDTVVVGKNMDALKHGLDRVEQVRLIGEVADLKPWYDQAMAVVAPIFSGSGMKTKVAEAWMFGKIVIGTPEAFMGYDVPPSCRVCVKAEEFISEIKALNGTPPSFNPDLRALFDARHSVKALTSRLQGILSSDKAGPR